MRLQSKTTAVLVTPVLLCIGVFAWFAYSQMRSSLMDASVHQLESIADLKVRQVERLIATHKAQIVAHANLVEGSFAAHRDDALAYRTLPAVLEDIVSSDPELAAAHFVDALGMVLASTTIEEREEPMPEALGPYDSISALEAGPRVRAFEISASSGPRLVVVDPVLAGDRFVGSLILRFNETPMRVAIESGVFGTSGELLMASQDRDGNARFLSDALQREDAAGTVLALGDRDDVPMVRALRGEEDVWTEGMRDYAGNDVIAVTRYIDELGWGLVSGVDLAEAIAPARRLRDTLLLLAAALIGFSWLASRYFAKRLTVAASKVEKELKRRTAAEKAFSDVLAASPTPIVGATEGVDGPLDVLFANRQAERLLGQSSIDLAGTPLCDLLSPDSRERFQNVLESWIPGADGEVPRLDARIVGADGEEIDVEIGVTKLHGPDDPTVLLTMVDVTERLRVRRMLHQRAEELARSNRELDRFAYVASHDLKAPLRSVDQLASFIQEDAADVLPEESREDLGLLRGRVARLEMLLNGLLEYSRVGRKEGESRWVDVGEALDDIRELYVPKDGFALVTEGTMPKVWAPRPALDLVFRNLIMNAVKHHDLSEGTVRIWAEDEAHSVVFFIEDDGPGIDVAFGERIFGLFETLRPRDEIEAGGVGLSIVRKTVEAHGGLVELVPSEGRGARFAVHWPRPSAHLVDSGEAA